MPTLTPPPADPTQGKAARHLHRRAGAPFSSRRGHRGGKRRHRRDGYRGQQQRRRDVGDVGRVQPVFCKTRGFGTTIPVCPRRLSQGFEGGILGLGGLAEGVDRRQEREEPLGHRGSYEEGRSAGCGPRDGPAPSRARLGGDEQAALELEVDSAAWRRCRWGSSAAGVSGEAGRAAPLAVSVEGARRVCGRDGERAAAAAPAPAPGFVLAC